LNSEASVIQKHDHCLNQHLQACWACDPLRSGQIEVERAEDDGKFHAQVYTTTFYKTRRVGLVIMAFTKSNRENDHLVAEAGINVVTVTA